MQSSRHPAEGSILECPLGTKSYENSAGALHADYGQSGDPDVSAHSAEAERSASEWLIVQHSVEAMDFHFHLLH